MDVEFRQMPFRHCIYFFSRRWREQCFPKTKLMLRYLRKCDAFRTPTIFSQKQLNILIVYWEKRVEWSSIRESEQVLVLPLLGYPFPQTLFSLITWILLFSSQLKQQFFTFEFSTEIAQNRPSGIQLLHLEQIYCPVSTSWVWRLLLWLGQM